MSLKSAIRSGVDAARNSVIGLMIPVDWTFTTTDAGDYDPLTETFSGNSNTIIGMMVLFYNDEDDDNQVSFSSQGISSRRLRN